MCVYYLRVLICKVFIYICVCTMSRVLICQGVYNFMCLYIYICMYYVKSVNMSRSLLFHVFICVCTMLRVLICLLFHVFIYMCVLC